LIKLPAGWRPTKNPELSGEWQPSWDYISRCIFGSLGYFALSGVFTYSASFFAEIDTNSSMYEHWYYRVMVNTTYFPIGTLFVMMGLAVLGWTFVNLITL